jgi:hypothetical protein
MEWRTFVWSKALKARGVSTDRPYGTTADPAQRFGVAATGGGSGGTEGHPNDKRATAPETAYGCTGGVKL